MRTLKGLLSAVGVVLLTLVVTAMFQSPLTEMFSAERLEARVILAPWVDRNSIEPSAARRSASLTPEGKAYQEALDDLNTSLATMSGASIDNIEFGVARFDVQNRSRNIVDNISLRFTNSTKAEEVQIFDGGVKKVSFKDTSNIKLPDMKPGDNITVFVWAKYGFSEYLFPENLETFSSAGPIQLSIRWPRVERRTAATRFDWFMQDWSEWVIGCVAFIFLLLLSAVAVVNDHYAKAMLHDGDFYLDEKTRFDLNIKEFKPDLDRANKIKVS